MEAHEAFTLATAFKSALLGCSSAHPPHPVVWPTHLDHSPSLAHTALEHGLNDGLCVCVRVCMSMA